MELFTQKPLYSKEYCTENYSNLSIQEVAISLVKSIPNTLELSNPYIITKHLKW